MDPDIVLRAEGLRKDFPVTRGVLFRRHTGAVKAVDGINFAIPAAATLGLVGESGCGKTTTAKLVLRLERPSSGRVLVDGQDVHALHGAALKSYRTKVQAVFQDPWSSLNPRRRVRDLVAMPLVVNRRVSRVELRDRVEQVLVAVGLRPEQADLYPHEFSGGQRQRVAVASALVSDPRLIILDEPVSALDVSIRSQIMNLFRDLQDQHGVAYLLVAHSLATTRFLAHAVAVMYLGRIVEQAPTEALFTEPLHPYTQALFAAELPGHPSQRGRLQPIPGEVPSPIDPPPGCPFHPRCPHADDRCRNVEPQIREVAPGHLVACHLY
jgi:peptide/nickel transport system ATP-binding protein/oligopeptide transport system ATP-binding protein